MTLTINPKRLQSEFTQIYMFRESTVFKICLDELPSSSQESSSALKDLDNKMITQNDNFESIEPKKLFVVKRGI